MRIPREEIPRTIRCDPTFTYYKPRGIPLSEIEDEFAVTIQELEAIRLTDLKGLSQRKAGEMMNVSQSTISRHVEEAHRKTAKALVHGLAIRITNPIDFFHCDHCGHTWPFPEDITSVQRCEKCKSKGFHPHFHTTSKSNSVFNKNQYEVSK